MMSKQKMAKFREKLDQTLACNDLVDEESIKKLVVRQFSLSPSNLSENNNEYIIERRSKEVKNFLDLQRSASGDHHNKPGDWKVKEANDEYRVMYREGLQGSPFHTLLVEGYADAPVDVCICAAWETSLYKKWWPQITVPTFRVTEARLLQKIRIGEHLSLTRMKVTWPLSAREVIVHYLEIEYFEGDLVIGLLNSVPDTDKVTNETHGFTNKGIPEAKDIIRMDIIGGTVMKKLSTNKTYFRTMAKMDLKLDFVPARLINFIARQILGGTCRLYQKTVASVAKGDEDFEEALKNPLYVRIREGLYSGEKLKNISENKNGESIPALSELHEIEEEEKAEPDSIEIEEDALEPVQSGLKEVEEQQNEPYSKGKKEDATVPDESGLEGNGKVDTELDQSDLKGNEGVMHHRTTSQDVEQYNGNGGSEKKIRISLQVQEALGMLDNLMGMVQKGEFGEQSSYDVECVNPEHVNSELVNTKVGLTSSISYKQEMDDISKGMEEANSDNDAHNSRSKPTYTSRELENNSTAPASPLGKNVPLAYNENEALKPSQDNEEVGVKVNTTHEGSPNHGREKSGQKKRWRYSCVHFTASLI
ncbi:uncharacterized protein LOC113323382 isoform X1 [Papaver somniferum]|uniref:uncharacterized protein LOC113323382 isoform X1 n=2 Tax=Papaver somniferum TaxID=3469 RepID=UPI000E6FD28F|nr:uncharacterized protein LOC113323382 isoform X1 [Papaver somniferum]